MTGAFRRDELIVSSKGGYITFDGEMPADPRAYFQEAFVKTGLIGPAGFGRQLALHDPEVPRRDDRARAAPTWDWRPSTSIFSTIPKGSWRRSDERNFSAACGWSSNFWNARSADGVIGVYGTATWNGYRVRPDNEDYLSLQELVDLAAQVGGPNHHFKVIQLPYSLAMPEAFTTPNQKVTGEDQKSSPCSKRPASWISRYGPARRFCRAV